MTSAPSGMVIEAVQPMRWKIDATTGPEGVRPVRLFVATTKDKVRTTPAANVKRRRTPDRPRGDTTDWKPRCAAALPKFSRKTRITDPNRKTAARPHRRAEAAASSDV